MAKQGRISHDQFPADICVQHIFSAENVGATYGSALKAALALHRLMLQEGPCKHHPCDLTDLATHGHYANLVNPQYKRVGIGIYAHDGITWLTEDFLS